MALATDDPIKKPTFPYPVDSEGKALQLRPWSVVGVHYLAFHLSWIAFFSSFMATFAPAAIITVIRDNLNLTKLDVGNTGVTAVCGAIGARLFFGTFTDMVGPRFAAASALLFFAPAVFLISMVQNFSGLAVTRFFIGCSLAMFVVCQMWTGSMFNARIVGTANALTGGWGNMGGGATQFIMPLIFQRFAMTTPAYEAWRWAFFVPGGIYIVVALCVLLLGQDSPLGDFRDLKKSGIMKKSGATLPLLKVGLLNYRAWILALTYGYSFGVELTVDNMIVSYLYSQFGLNLTTAGYLGSIFGLMNVFSRASGGLISDILARYYGIRGRLWWLWTIQSLGGAFCLILAYVDYSLSATIVVMVIFSIFCQQACGATFGIVPFVSRRSYGVVSGLVGAGGNTGSAVTQALFFAGAANWQANLSNQDGLKWMGVMTLGITVSLFFLEFPMWGGMLRGPRPGVTEEDYYLKEWSAEEIAAGLHHPSIKFAMESRSQRGMAFRRAAEPVEPAVPLDMVQVKPEVAGAGDSVSDDSAHPRE